MIQFITDGMLGRFTRWLRILGFDVVYDPAISDNNLLMIAETEDRVILTRDHELYQRARCRGLITQYLTGTSVHDMLVEVGKHFSLSFQLSTSTSRCPLCGAYLKQVDKYIIQNEIQNGTAQHYSNFWRCTNCGKIYWQGSHWTRIEKVLANVTNLLNSRPN